MRDWGVSHALRADGLGTDAAGTGARAGGGGLFERVSAQKHSRNRSLACPRGIEPLTTCLEGRCSIQLSYGQQVQVEGRVAHLRCGADFAMHAFGGA